MTIFLKGKSVHIFIFLSKINIHYCKQKKIDKDTNDDKNNNFQAIPQIKLKGKLVRKFQYLNNIQLSLLSAKIFVIC